MIIGKPIEYPPAPFQPGDRVRFFLSDDNDECGIIYTVEYCDHCFTWLEGRRFGISNWRLRRVHKARPSTTEKIPKRDREDRVSIDSKKLRASAESLESTRP